MSVCTVQEKKHLLMMMRSQTSDVHICIINISDYCQVIEPP